MKNVRGRVLKFSGRAFDVKRQLFFTGLHREIERSEWDIIVFSKRFTIQQKPWSVCIRGSSAKAKPKPFKFEDKADGNLFAVVVNCILNSRLRVCPPWLMYRQHCRALFRRCFKYRHIGAFIYLEEWTREMLPA